MSLPTSDEPLLLLHNPRCSKSRATRELLQERGVPFEERRYLDTPLSFGELVELRRRLGRAPLEWVRSREKAYAEAGLSPDAGEETVLSAMAEHPILMERPIVVRGHKAVVARPPEQAMTLL